ncbi:MAG TPA: Gfo/Idh/MocA family oxidoreductase [Planctomycetota bacterium]|nr:Gfo/Idh/MocA family oxidoreductase [Planctomycetota bacterium]
MPKPSPPSSPPPLRVGLVGAGRTRQGLGPYLATALEAAGARVTAVSGRDLGAARLAAVALAERLQHPVSAAASAADLARGVQALVVASPVGRHLEGLDAALAAGVPCLCEKPLVDWQQADAAQQRIAAFAARGLLLDENCQWPFVLPALFDLHPGLVGAPVREVAMGLGPAAVGPTMIVDSLSHVLSVVQSLAVLDGHAPVTRVQQSESAALAEHNDVRFELAATTGPIAVHLHLRRCPEPPRPAWLAVNGARVDRRIGADYAQSFVAADGREAKVRDPLQQLVYRFVALTQAKDLERTSALASFAALRLRLYTDILRTLEGGRRSRE